jgi:hypothetical protein
MEIIIKGKNGMGRTRSEQEENLRKEWGKTITDEQLSRLKHFEKKIKDETGSQDNFVNAHIIDRVK